MKNQSKVLTVELKPERTPESTSSPTVFDTLKSRKELAGKSKCKISPLKLHENFENKIENDKKSINNEIFREYFLYRNSSFLTKDLHKAN